jgi:hypothetical protein
VKRERPACFIVLVIALVCGALCAPRDARAGTQQCPTKDCDPARLARRSLNAARISGPPPLIDGRLDDAAWAGAEAATDFVENTPRPGAPSSLRSEARVLVDDKAVYIALSYDDPSPDRILAPLARRDDETTSDWAFVEIDSRHDRRSAFSFGINPRGVQVDGAWTNDIQWDQSWNAVWESAARIDDRGWTAEFRIPFSQLAFNLPRGAETLVWGINFYRYSPFHGESSNWSPRYRGLGGVVSRFNDLCVPAPAGVTRLEITPYVAPRAGDDGATASAHGSVRAGADMKVGLGSNFTLTGTVLPDFGQVEADPSQVNLTAFELFQTERRPFFLEGLDLFKLDTSLAFSSRGVSFGNESPFYSRRVGRAPRGEAPADAAIVSMPGETTLLGAAKLSGQTSRGWTLGLFTALTSGEEAIVRSAGGVGGAAGVSSAGSARGESSAGDQSGKSGDAPGMRRWAVEPRAALTLARAVKSLRRGESSVGFFVADVHRFGLGPESELASQFVRDQAVAGVDAQHRFGHRQFEIRGWALASRLAGDPSAVARITNAPQHYFQRPDSREAEAKTAGTAAAAEAEMTAGASAPGRAHLTGGTGEVRVSKIGGSLRWDVIGRAVSPGFDVNEIGFQRNADWLLLAGRWQYDRFRPGHWIRAWSVGSDNAGLGWSWSGGEPRARAVNGFGSIDWRNYWSMRLTMAHAWESLSMERLRGGPALLLPARDDVTVSVLTDQRKASFVTVDASAGREPRSGSWGASIAPLVNIRSSERLQWSIGPSYAVDVVGWQVVGDITPPRRAGGASLGGLAGIDVDADADAGRLLALASLSAAPAPSYIVGRVTQRTLSLTMRSDFVFSPRLVLQLYAQPFGTVGRYDRYQRLAAPRDPDPARRFAPIAVQETPAAASPAAAPELGIDLDGDGLLDGTLASPAAQQRTLNANAVLRWEYRPGSFLTFVWNHRRDVTAADATRSPANALGALPGDPSTNVILLKASFRLGS